jgi:pimeloyl-ACP methyl ester carboxylesterase
VTFLLIACGVVAALIAAGVLYQWAGARADLRRYAGQGRWVEVGPGRRLFVRERGAAGPSLVFEAGIGATNLNWFQVQERVSEFARTAAYDREGLGWSSACSTPRTPSYCAETLGAMLKSAGIAPPYVLVGHSFGGLVMRRFALEHPDEVAGLVLIDPMRCEDWPPLKPEKQSHLDRGMRMLRVAIPIARIGLARIAVTSLLRSDGWLWNRLASITSKGPQHVLARVRDEIRKLPVEIWPLMAAYWSRPEFYRGMHEHLAAVPQTVREMMDAGPICGIPVLVLTPDSSTPLSEETLRQIGDDVRQVIVAGTAHWIHLDQPDVVVEAIREAVNAVMRQPSPAYNSAAMFFPETRRSHNRISVSEGEQVFVAGDEIVGVRRE